MRRTRSTKIIATLGPASASYEKIDALFQAGADVFRLNFSHGHYEEHKKVRDIIRDIERKHRRPIGIVVDLQGPKLRLGAFAAGKASLLAGTLFRLDLEPEAGDSHRVSLPHPEIFSALFDGTHLLVDDGKILLRVEHHNDTFAETRVIIGGVLSDYKGVNVPGVILDLSPLTQKDRRDLDFGLEIGVDWVALSFVQRPEDVAEVRKLVGGRAMILSKIEKPSAIDYLSDIIYLSDAVMVARGDLGVEVPPEHVPILQKRIVRAGRRVGKPVVVATQMLESMIYTPAPTRAEASDVATAVYDGADAVMLSAETAIGDYAVEAVTLMDRIINRVEQDETYTVITDASREPPENTVADAISAAARQVASTLHAAAIVTYTSSGSTTLRAARERPTVPIVCLTANLAVARRLSLLWGTHCAVAREISSLTDMIRKACRVAHRAAFAQIGEHIVITAGIPFGIPGTTNILRITWLDGSDKL
ncbi:Pyruvate kinase [invertebrate metagenome]|uniref:pyruvate kinase n=1 Tax=invertebrate metagenome TaxID=1711999 RepID=A0A484HC97_9ZZZZ